MKLIILAFLVSGCSFSIQAKSLREEIEEKKVKEAEESQARNKRVAAGCIDMCKPYRAMYFSVTDWRCICEVSK